MTGRTAGERAQTVAIEVGQDRIQPTPDIAAMEQVFGAQRAHQRVLHKIVGDLGIARERPRIASQRRNRYLDALTKSAHGLLPSIRARPGAHRQTH